MQMIFLMTFVAEYKDFHLFSALLSGIMYNVYSLYLIKISLDEMIKESPTLTFEPFNEVSGEKREIAQVQDEVNEGVKGRN